MHVSTCVLKLNFEPIIFVCLLRLIHLFCLVNILLGKSNGYDLKYAGELGFKEEGRVWLGGCRLGMKPIRLLSRNLDAKNDDL